MSIGKRMKPAEETGAELIWGDPNWYFKDSYVFSDKSADVSFAEIDKWKEDLEKFKIRQNSLVGIASSWVNNFLI
jgi:hypothetical protein